MQSLLFILAGLAACWYFTELGAESALRSVVAPLGVVLLLIALALWLVFKAGFGAKTGSSNVCGFGGLDSGGDC